MTSIRIPDEGLAAAALRAAEGASAVGAAPARATARVLLHVLRDVSRGRWLVAYGLFFLVATEALVRFAGGGTRALLSLANLTLLVVPLVGIAFGTMYLYGAREFIELLLAQPVRRRQLFTGLYLGVALPLVAALAAGIGVPFVLHGLTGPGDVRALAALLLAGAGLTLAFTAIAFLIAVRTDDRVRGLGVAIAVWLASAVLYDGLVLVVATTLSEYPLEGPMIGMMLLNPVDLARVALLLQFDVSALMGYTGAVFQRFFGSAGGLLLAAGAFLLWIVMPAALARRLFQRKDF